MNQKVIGVFSGKGGVGKTTLSAALTVLARDDEEVNPMVLDCDVDAPNLSMILPKSENDNYYQKDSLSKLESRFLPEKCTHCKQCVDDKYCEFHAITWNEEKEVPIVNILKCEGCGACQYLCPEHAFEIKNVKSGEIIAYDTEMDLPLVFGKTTLGSTVSGRLVSEVKEYAKQKEDFDTYNLVIIDGPPGIGCPVIAALTELDYVILITEPTPAGFHDLLRIIDVVNQFQIPFGLVVNKSDIKSDFQSKFDEFIEETQYPVLGYIPFDLAIPEAMSYAKPVVTQAPDSQASKAIKEIYSKFKETLLKNN